MIIPMRNSKALRLTAWFLIALASGCGGGGGDSQTPPPACSVGVTGLDFGSVTVGQTKDLPFTITNTGQGTLSGTVSETCTDYAIQGAATYNLDFRASTTLTVRFAPTVAGTRICTLTLGAGCAPVPCTGIGVSTGCQVAPTALDFGTVSLGSSVDRMFTITNTSASALIGTASSPCADFSIQGSASYNLAPAASATITVRFAPSVSGTANCTIETGGALCADVTCSGTGLELNSGLVSAGGTYPHTFLTAGSFPYHCEIHTVMKGTVIVDPASLVTSVSVSIVSATSSGFSPPSVTVAPGGTVTWTNNHSVTHTVTSD